MWLPGSYANGFAPRDGEPLYPELWRGCVGAWSPCLGPTGTVLRDWSGRCNHGNLVNGPSWGIVAGKNAIGFDGVNDYINFGSRTQLAAGFSVSMWIRATAIANFSYIVGDYQNATGAFGWAIRGMTSGAGRVPSLAVGSATGGNNDTWATCPYNLNDGAWHHFGVSVSQAGNSGTYYSGGFSAAIGFGGKTIAPATGEMWAGVGPYAANYAAFQMTDFLIIHRVLPASAFAILGTWPGIAHELAPIRYAGSGDGSSLLTLRQGIHMGNRGVKNASGSSALSLGTFMGDRGVT